MRTRSAQPGVPVDRLVVAAVAETLIQRGLGPEARDLALLHELLGELAEVDAREAITVLVGLVAPAFELLAAARGLEALEFLRELAVSRADPASRPHDETGPTK
jgi:hypothetical protein